MFQTVKALRQTVRQLEDEAKKLRARIDELQTTVSWTAEDARQWRQQALDNQRAAQSATEEARRERARRKIAEQAYEGIAAAFQRYRRETA